MSALVPRLLEESALDSVHIRKTLSGCVADLGDSPWKPRRRLGEERKRRKASKGS